MTLGPSMINKRDRFGCGLYHSSVHSGRPVIGTAGSSDQPGYDGIGTNTSEIWDFTVPGSQWQLASK